MDIKIDTSQIKILQDFFDDLSTIDQRKIFMSAYRKAAKPLIAAARANSPTQSIRKSIGSIEIPERVGIEVGSKTNTMHVAYRNGKYTMSKVWYAHLFEWGTNERFRKLRRKTRSGNWRGVTKGTGATGKINRTDFFLNAWNSTKEQVDNNINQEWFNEINRRIIKVNNKLK